MVDQILDASGSEATDGFFPPVLDEEGEPADLEEVLSELRPPFSQSREDRGLFEAYLFLYPESTFAKWMEIYRTFVDSSSYDEKRVSFTGQGKEYPGYKFVIGLSHYSTAVDEHSLGGVTFEVRDTFSRRAVFNSNGSAYNPEIIVRQNTDGIDPNLLGVREEIERSNKFGQFKLKLYDLLFPNEID